ncbi:hypothetical protein ACFX1W_004055 [Malus domestica]
MADFIADFTYPVDIVFTPKEVVSLPSEPQKIEPTAPAWSLYVDGSSNQQGCRAGLVLTTPDKVAMEYVLRFKFKALNNEAEYEALIASLRLAKLLGVKRIVAQPLPLPDHPNSSSDKQSCRWFSSPRLSGGRQDWEKNLGRIVSSTKHHGCRSVQLTTRG